MSAIRVNVTQRDIERGVADAVGSCPIARALRRHAGWERAFVTSNRAYVPNGQTARLPSIAASFTARFDYGYEVKPFSFTLRVLA